MKPCPPLPRLALLAAWVVFKPALLGCGLDWSAPRNHFDGLDEQGHVMFVDSLGNLALQDGTTLPLYTMFKSSWTNSSPYLGQGWMLPLLDSRIVQVDDNAFQLWMPNGRYQYLGRDAGNPNLLNGQSGWKAEIQGNTITAWATCGWKLTYDSGKISSITTPGNQVLEMTYRDGQITEVRDNGAPVLSVSVDPNSGLVDGLTVNGKTIGLKESNKPVVQVVDGKTVVGQVSPSLSQATLADGTSKTYQFKVDDKTNPELIVDKRTISWDPVTQLATKDGDWTYDIKPDAEGAGQPDITRTNSKGQSEFYSLNPWTGTETVQGMNGVRQITDTFINSSTLAGHIRSVSRSVNGSSAVLIKRYDYDETGKMIRETLYGTTPHQFIFKYNSFGKQIEVDKDGTLFMTKTFDAQGRLLSKQFSTGLRETYSYLTDGVEQTTHLKSGKLIVTKLPNAVMAMERKEVSSLETIIK